MVALTFLVFGAARSYGEEKTEIDERFELFESRKYKRLCKRYNKPGKISQTERADAGLEPKVLCRAPPIFPDECERKAKKRETVKLVFDITPDGLVENIRLLEATNECFVVAAARSVYLYKYGLTDEGAKNVEASITFVLERR
jgi:Gram-negative bacterial TonB protein C-terminal